MTYKTISVDPRAYTLQMIAKALEVDYSVFVEIEVDPVQRGKQDNAFLAILHLSGMLPLIFPVVLIWNLKKDKSEEAFNHFRAALLLQLVLLGIAVVGLWLYWKMKQPMPLLGGWVAGALLSIVNAARVFNGESYINPLIKSDEEG